MIPVKVVKAIWKNLRTVFGREVPKCIPGRSGDSGDEGDDLYTGEWPFFHHLRFLTDSMRGRNMSGPLTSTQNENTMQNSLESQNQTEVLVASSPHPQPQLRSDEDYFEEVIVHEEEEDFNVIRVGSVQRSSSAGTVLN